MALQLSLAVRNNILDQLEATIGASAVLRIFSGSKPADCAAPDSGDLLSTIICPVDYLTDAVLGVKMINGNWFDTSADNDGTAGYFRLYASDGTTCHMQGTVSTTGGGGDMTIDYVDFRATQTFVITTFTITAPGA